MHRSDLARSCPASVVVVFSLPDQPGDKSAPCTGKDSPDKAAAKFTAESRKEIISDNRANRAEYRIFDRQAALIRRI